MEFLPKIIIFIAVCHIARSKSYFDYQHYQPFHRPWAIKYPQPLISIDGPWPMGYPYQISRDEYPYEDEEDTYQQELLTKSLNQALIKLNRLLPASSFKVQETTSYPPTTKPEVVAEALNRAIDRLTLFLTIGPVPLNNNHGITSTDIPKPDFVTKNKVSSTTEMPQQSTMGSENISNSVSNAIEELDKLFVTLPDELRANPTKIPVRNNNNQIGQNIPPNFINVPMFIPENQPQNNIKEIILKNPDIKEVTSSDTEEYTLFTSHPLIGKHKVTNKVETDYNNMQPFTSVPHIHGSSVIITTTQRSDDNKLFTSIVPTENKSDITTVSPIENSDNASPVTQNDVITSPSIVPTEIDLKTSPSVTIYPPVVQTEINVVTSFSSPENNIETTENNIETRVSSENETDENKTTDLPIKDSNSEMTTVNDVLTTTEKIPVIDVRFNEERSDSIVFPDQFQEIVSQNREPIKQETNLENRFGESSTQISLEYKPSRPPFHPEIFPPNPRPQNNPNLETTTKTQQKPIEYNPINPDVFPPHPFPSLQQPDSNLQTTNLNLGDRNKPTTISQGQNSVNNQNTPIILDYKPSRPPFHPDVFPPYPSSRPQTDPNLQNKPTSVLPTQRPINTENPQIVLGYKPSRPPFHPDVYPPVPTARPQTDSNLQSGTNFELGDRNKPGNVFNGQKPPQTQTPLPITTTTQRIFTTTQNNEPYRPTHYYSTPLSLEYKPTRPFYAPNPIFYPQPIIRPGTPWPAVSTERPKN